MIKQEIIEKISKYFKLTHFEAEKIYDDIFAGIIQGVKEDNIADITNLGEFIIKYNNNGDSTHKKTVEFLPTLSLEEEINQRGFEEQKTFASEYESKTQTDTPVENKPLIEHPVVNNPVELHSDQSENKSNVEDDIRKKREEILSKMTSPKEEVKSTITTTTTEIKETVVTPFVAPVQEIQEIKEDIKEIKEEITAKASDITDVNKPVVEETSEKSFSDYFTEVKEEKVVSDLGNKTTTPPVENVIPPTAVELHNQITGDQANKNINYQPSVTPPPYANGNGNGNGNGHGNGNGNGNGNGTEHVLQDNSYYIWYKDSEPNVTDTQTMSYEYELLYQATKEAEYKSKLRIYVTTFIMFFSIVLLLLILSPVIYKYFFTPGEEQQSEEVQETSSNGVEPQQPNNQASVNSLENNNTQSTPPVTENTQQSTPPVNEQPKQEEAKQEQPKQEQPKQEAPKEQPKQETQQPVQQQPTQQNSPKLDGVVKNGMGWMDEKYRVIYVQLENGKYTIQESAWDSDAKANKRLGIVGGIVPGLKGSVVKVDLGSKGVWYRARLGEFATLEEAKSKAEELRNKEDRKLQALLLTFLLYA